MKRIILYITALTISIQLLANDNKIDDINKLLDKAERTIYTNPKEAARIAFEVRNLIRRNPEVGNDKKAKAIYVYSYAEQLIGNFDLSLKTLYDGLFFIPEENEKLKAMYHMLMGRIYGKMGDSVKALELNNKATEMFKSLGDSTLIAACYNEKGVIHHLFLQPEQAEYFLEKSLEINKRLGNEEGIAINYNTFALDRGKLNEKQTLLVEAIRINKKKGNDWWLGENYNNLGRIYYFEEKYDKAIETLEVGKRYIDKIGAKELLADNYEYLSWIYASLGEYKKAYETANIRQGLINEIQNNNKLRNMEQDIAQKALREKQYEIDKSKDRNKLIKLERNLYISLSFLIIIIIVGIATYLWNRRKKKIELIEEHAKHLLEQKNKKEKELERMEAVHIDAEKELKKSHNDITELALFISAQNDFLNKVKEAVKAGYKISADKIPTHLKLISTMIAQYQKGKSMQNFLLYNVENKGNEFLKRLLLSYPNLTPGEKHLSILLRIGMSSKDIAILTGTTPKSVAMNKYRLKKTLNLTSEQDLEEFLRNF